MKARTLWRLWNFTYLGKGKIRHSTNWVHEPLDSRFHCEFTTVTAGLSVHSGFWPDLLFGLTYTFSLIPGGPVTETKSGWLLSLPVGCLVDVMSLRDVLLTFEASAMLVNCKRGRRKSPSSTNQRPANQVIGKHQNTAGQWTTSGSAMLRCYWLRAKRRFETSALIGWHNAHVKQRH